MEEDSGRGVAVSLLSSENDVDLLNGHCIVSV